MTWRKRGHVGTGLRGRQAAPVPRPSNQLQPPAPPLEKTCRLDDPFVSAPFWMFLDESLCAYLVALAAFQRGLSVRFHYQVLDRSPRFAHLLAQGPAGHLFSVSDGQRTHYFRRGQGDLTTREVSRIMDDKAATKALLSQHGISVPPGVVVDKARLAEAKAFCNKHPGEHFLIKPLAGTLGRGVHRDLTVDEALKILARHADPMVLEVFIRGQEYRVHVVDGRYIGAVARLPAHVTGDGSSTVAALIEARNQVRSRHPFYRKMLINVSDDLIAELETQGLTLESVPAPAERVRLGRLPKNNAGGESPIRSYELSNQARQVAVRVQQVLGVPNTGIDLLVCDEGTPKERVVILEANQCPFQTALAVPLVPAKGMGNFAAEALIDTYFPASRSSPRWPAASFNFVALRHMLTQCVAASLAVPTIEPGWLHQRLRIPPGNLADDQVNHHLQKMAGSNAIIQTLKQKDGAWLVDALGSSTDLQHLWALWPVGDRCDP